MIHNLITSRAVPEIVTELGGTPVRTRVGHSYIKATMAETDAVFGGEHSGHFYFRDFWRADSGMLAALHTLAALADTDRPLSELAADYERYVVSGEINSTVDDQAAIVAEIEAAYAGGRRDDRPPRRPDRHHRRLVVQRAAVQHRTAAPAQRRGQGHRHHGAGARRGAGPHQGQPDQEEPMNIDPALRELIVCPSCHASLDEVGEELVCTGCGLAYPVRDDIPVLLVDEARSPTDRRAMALVRRVPARRRGHPRRRRPARSASSRSPARASAARPARRRAPWPRPSRSPASRPVRGRWSPPAPTPGCCGPPSSRGARCRSWPGPTRGCPAGPVALDLVVVLAPDGGDVGTASAVAEAVRRGCQVVVACPARLPRRRARRRPLEHDPAHARPATSWPRRRWCWSTSTASTSARRPTTSRSPTPSTGWRMACSPHRDIAVNPAKMLAIALADANPVVWGGSVLAARAARRVAESIRRASGRTALAGDAEHLLPVIEAASPRNVFDDPFDDEPCELRPVLVVLDDGADDPLVREQRGRLQAAAVEHGVRTETVDADAAGEVARYASLLLSGRYAAAYLSIGLIND